MHFTKSNQQVIKKIGNDRQTLTKAVKSCGITIEKPAALQPRVGDCISGLMFAFYTPLTRAS
ncbi:hypothetical protein [Mesorhizobium sp. M0768]|uniref:hypothetical protein n=1 Tax=Mesorhizobium sp. M0768 TaxID=2956996 RepID=UPI00333C0943